MPSRARAAARLMAVVVLPTPPFWLTTAMTLEGGGEVEGGFSGLVWMSVWDSGWDSVWASVWVSGLEDGWMVIIGVGEGYRAEVDVAMRLGCAEVVKVVENLWNAFFGEGLRGLGVEGVWKSFVSPLFGAEQTWNI